MSIAAAPEQLAVFVTQNFQFQMKTFTKFHKFVIGLGAFAGATVYYLNSPNKIEVFNSWTTNHTLSSPLAKWDDNWDQ